MTNFSRTPVTFIGPGIKLIWGKIEHLMRSGPICGRIDLVWESRRDRGTAAIGASRRQRRHCVIERAEYELGSATIKMQPTW
jgi:hypothetical protein